MELKDLKVGDTVLYTNGYGEKALYDVLDITKSGYIKVGYKDDSKKGKYCLFSAKTGLPKGNTLSHQRIKPIEQREIIENKREDFAKWVNNHLKNDHSRTLTFEQAMAIARILRLQFNDTLDDIERFCKL